MIPYYNPHLYLSTIFKSFFVRNPEKKIIEFFRQYTGKKYILLTDSCRSALKLAYICLGKKGEVITSPLTCQVAIRPIVESGNKPKYIDIRQDTLVMDEQLIEEAISDKTIAIQAIHFGGTPCRMDTISDIANTKKIVLIEDCAQGYGAKYKGKNVGSWGDISCFSMIKNMYGIGGGVFATDDHSYFIKAKDMLKKTNKSKFQLSFYRVFLGIIETNRSYAFFEKLYNILKTTIKSNKRSKINIHRPNLIELKINYLQLLNSKIINKKRIELAKQNLDIIRKQLGIENYLEDNNLSYSYVKFNLFSRKFDVNKIGIINSEMVEAKHLEHKYKVSYQKKLTNDMKLINYNIVHDKLISLPIEENINNKMYETLLKVIRNG